MQFKEIYQKAKKGKEDTVVIEGIHAFKHAMRFGAICRDAIVHDKEAVMHMMARIATQKDAEYVRQHARVVDEKTFRDIASDTVRTGLIALATKPHYTVSDMREGPIVFLENPRDIDNVGAVIRVAAGFGAGGVCVTGEVNPWHMMAVRAAAGLQWAVPTLHVASLTDIARGRTVYACDADGNDMYAANVDKNGIFIFGTERDGITQETKKRADHIIAIPMQHGVSSLNLATSVSAVLYGSLPGKK